MSLDKAIKHNKEHRKPYYKSKAFDRSCCNHSGCPWCEQNRKHQDLVGRIEAEEAILEFEKENTEK